MNGEVLVSSLCLTLIAKKYIYILGASSDFNEIMAILSLKSGDFSSILISTLQLLMNLDKMSWIIFIILSYIKSNYIIPTQPVGNKNFSAEKRKM